MRFLIVIVGVFRGIVKGVRNEVHRLANISKLNGFINQRKEEVVIEYERLGEYVYCNQKAINDEYIQQLSTTIQMLVSEIESYEQQLQQLRDE